MNYIGLIILLIVVIITILYFIKISSENNDIIIEKYDTQNIQKFSADYLNTNGKSPIIHDSSDSHKDVRYLTMNDYKTSTATFRPCQIHFNDDGTSKYIYEDDWKEFNTLTSEEDKSVYNVPYKKFANDKNNINENYNFNETAKCFKEKNIRTNLNTYKYKSNDLIKYKPDSYVAIKFKDDNDKDQTKLFMQMFFDKQPEDSLQNKYKDESLDSICSYNYKRDLSLGYLNLYRLTIVPVSNNKNIPIDTNSIKNGIITAIDSIIIENEDNSLFKINNKQFTESKLAELLVGINISYYSISNGNIIYRVDKKEASGDDLNGINIKLYKFNRNLDCSDQAIKSYEIADARLKSYLMINAEPYISPSINPQNHLPADEIISENDQNKYIPTNSIEETLSQEINGISKNILIKALNIRSKTNYDTKEELLDYILYFILKIIVISNSNLIPQIIKLMKENEKNTDRKRDFLNTFNNFKKFINLYRDNKESALKKEILEDIKKKKNIEFDQIYMHKFKKIELIPPDDKIPFTLENINDKLANLYIYTTDTENKQFIINQNINCDILIVAGGGAGGRNPYPSGRAGGGGGAGGLLYYQNINLSAGTYNITVGNGGDITNTVGNNGGNSSFHTYTAIGGGGGGSAPEPPYHSVTGIAGGSGGGGGERGGGGSGISGQGYNGGVSNGHHYWGGAGAGGGGAQGSGGNFNSCTYHSWSQYYWPYPHCASIGPNGYSGGNGGAGRSISISGTNVTYAKGGNGGWWDNSNNPVSGLPNTGNGGDGAGFKPAGKGGSGIVIVKINTELKRSPYDSIKKVENTIKRKFTIYGNELKTNDLSSKIIMKEKDILLTINNTTRVTLKKYTTYIIDKANSQEIRIREEIEKEKIFKEIDFVYTNPGNHTFKVPSDVTNICIVCVGGGGGANTTTNDGGGGGGGGLIWVNNLNVTPETVFNITVGAGGSPGVNGASSVFFNSNIIRIEAYGGDTSRNTTYGGRGGSYGLSYSKNIDAGGGYGGNGGSGSVAYGGDWLAGGGGGAGGYLGKGGNGSSGEYNGKRGENGTGGGGGGGGRGNSRGGGGGGVGLYGIGSNGIGNTDYSPDSGPGGGGGSGGSSGNGITGGVYGGGGGGGDYITGGSGGNGAVRIICTQSKTFPNNAGATQGSRIIPGVYNTIATFNTSSIELSYDTEDIDLLNYNNAINNKEIDQNQVQRIIGKLLSDSISYEYKIGTKTKEEYLKIGFMIRFLDSETLDLWKNERTKLEEFKNNDIIFINPNGKGKLENSKDYYFEETGFQDNDVITLGRVVIFKNTFSGDIILKTYVKSFIYDVTIDPNKEIIRDVESDYINGRNNNNSLVSIISAYESKINNYFGLNTYDSDSKKIYNMATYFTINSKDRTIKIERFTDARRDILTKLQNIYNSVLTFNANDASRKPKITFVNDKKAIDIIPTFNINNISYENPINKHAETYNTQYYHHQPISNNYVYFKYPL